MDKQFFSSFFPEDFLIKKYFWDFFPLNPQERPGWINTSFQKKLKTQGAWA